VIARTRTIAGLAILGALLSLACALPLRAVAAKSVIAFSRVDEDFARQRIIMARPDGSHVRQLTHPQKKKTLDGDANISPDGTQVVFERDLRNGKEAQIVIIGADGKNEQVADLGCVDPCADDVAPTWFPSASRIAFTRVVGPFDAPNESARSAVLQSTLPDGSDIQRLSEPGIDGVYEDYFARFSPDGSYVLFTRVRNQPFDSAVFRMDLDGTDIVQLTRWKLDADLADLSPATSGPTADLAVFETYGHGAPKGKNQNIVTVPTTCGSVKGCKSKLTYLTQHGDGARASFNATWSPNGRKIAYTEFRDETENHECCLGDIFTMRFDGSHRRPVSESPMFEYRPDWGPVP
jgi:Tol biopolymer transport system component